jgi:hypothetical protein
MTVPGIGSTPRRVSITSNGITGRVLLDETDITDHVHGYTIQQQPGQAPVVMLHAHPAGGALFEGLAHVVLTDDQDPADLIVAFLTNISPAALEDAALNRDDLDDQRYALTRAMLAQLADWARGNG